MKRRDLLKGLGAGILALPLTAPALEAITKDAPVFDIRKEFPNISKIMYVKAPYKDLTYENIKLLFSRMTIAMKRETGYDIDTVIMGQEVMDRIRQVPSKSISESESQRPHIFPSSGAIWGIRLKVDNKLTGSHMVIGVIEEFPVVVVGEYNSVRVES
jgi:hypothetical protein